MDRPFPRFTLLLVVAAQASAAAFFLDTVSLATNDLSDYHWPRRITVLLATVSTILARVEWRLRKPASRRRQAFSSP